MIRPSVAVCLLAWTGTSFAPPAAQAEPNHTRFLDGLRERQLFELAEKYCKDELAKLLPVEAARVELAIELIRTYCGHAVHADPAHRQELWQQARAAAAEQLRQAPDHPRAVLLRFADALTPLAAGELARQELEFGVALPERQAEALAALREATALLEALDAELTREIPLRRRTSPRAGELSADGLFALQQQVTHQLARAQKNRALLFAAGSDDRLALLLAAAETLQRPLAQLPREDPLAAAVQLDLAECQRLLGHFDEAGELAVTLERAGVAPQTRQRARAELIRIAIGQNQPAAVQRLLEQDLSSEGPTSSELALARFEACLHLARAARAGSLRPKPEAAAVRPLSAAELAKQYEAEAAELARSLEEAHGAYWGRRAGQLLAIDRPRGGAGSSSAELLARTADGLLLKGNAAEAIAAYDEAAAAARTESDLNAAFELAYKAALVQQRRKDNAAAATRLRILAKSLATHEQAPAVHLLAAWNAAQLSREDASRSENYRELLREHLATFPHSPTVNQARLWLGRWHQAQGAWPEAVDAYAGIAAESEHFPAAVQALARCWPAELAALSAAGQQPQDRAAEAIEFFRSASETVPAASLTATELILAWQPERARDAEILLDRALAGAVDEPPAWRTAAQAQRIAAIASQPGRADDALAKLQNAEATPGEMFAVLQFLSTPNLASPRRAEVAKVQLALVAALAPRRNQLSPAEQTELDCLHADALAAVGRSDEAIALAAALAKANPNRGSIQERYAELLLASEAKDNWKTGLDRWRLVASRTKPRTAAWYRAKYSVAEAQVKLGDRAGAATLLQFVLETPPGLKGTEWEARYQALLEQCSRKEPINSP
jgi:hypothetical protein